MEDNNTSGIDHELLESQIQDLKEKVQSLESEKMELEAHLQQVQEHSWSGNWELDLVSKKVTWSKNVFKMLNYENTVQPDMRLFNSRLSPEASDKLNGAIKKVFIEKNNYSFEHDIDQDNGRTINVRTDLSITLDESGVPTKLVGITRDISSIKSAQQQLEKLSMIVSTTSNAAVFLDTETNIHWVNNGFVLMTGYRLDELKGKPFKELLYPNMMKVADRDNLFNLLSKEHAFKEELRLKTKNRKDLWVLLNINPILDYELKPESYVAIMSDISFQKESERLLLDQKSMIEKQNDGLEEKNNQLSTALREVARAKIGRKALLITFVLGIILFMFSEIVVDPFIESYFEKSGTFVLGGKLLIALMLKPIEETVRRNLFRAEVRKRRELGKLSIPE